MKKSTTMLIGTEQRIGEKNFPKIKIGDMIGHHSHTKLFGAEIDSNLNWKELVNISAEKSKHRPS